MIILRTTETDIETCATKAATVLRDGGIVLYPTDTLYGLAVDGSNSVAITRLQNLKGRDMRKSISAVFRDSTMIGHYAEIPPIAQKLIDTNLPGPLTLVLPTRKKEFLNLASDNTIGVRIPDDRFTRTLSRIFDGPYTATSANVSGFPVQTQVDQILVQFGQLSKEIDLVIDDGPRKGGIPSTVVRVTPETVEILREGIVSREALGL